MTVRQEEWSLDMMPGTTVKGNSKQKICIQTFPLQIYRFAELVAGIFINKKFKVYLFSGYTPTPYAVCDLTP